MHVILILKLTKASYPKLADSKQGSRYEWYFPKVTLGMVLSPANVLKCGKTSFKALCITLPLEKPDFTFALPPALRFTLGNLIQQRA